LPASTPKISVYAPAGGSCKVKRTIRGCGFDPAFALRDPAWLAGQRSAASGAPASITGGVSASRPWNSAEAWSKAPIRQTVVSAAGRRAAASNANGMRVGL
jgi:hypothetical protein